MKGGALRLLASSLLSVVYEAYLAGGSTRCVEAFVEALGVAAGSKSEVSRNLRGSRCRGAAFRASLTRVRSRQRSGIETGLDRRSSGCPIHRVNHARRCVSSDCTSARADAPAFHTQSASRIATRVLQIRNSCGTDVAAELDLRLSTVWASINLPERE